MKRCDIAIVGGGPAGLVSAGLLARQGGRVVVYERGSPHGARVGETLGAEVGPLLQSAGAWEAVAPVLARQAPYAEVRSAWGSPTPEITDSILRPLGAGWHVDRQQFDAALAEWAQAEGVEIHGSVGSCHVAREGGAMAVVPHRGPAVWAERVVDASGRGAPATRGLHDIPWVAVDRQVGLVASYPRGELPDDVPGLLLEAHEHGFWYTAPQPGGRLVAVLLTDADILQKLGCDPWQRLRAGLAGSPLTAKRLGQRLPEGRPAVFRSDSGWLAADRGPQWRAVGDAAMATDPLGGNGIARALRSALDLAKAPAAPFDLAAAQKVFSDFRVVRGRYYWLEGRWPSAPFWARRRPLDAEGQPLYVSEVAISLDPRAILVAGTALPAAAEAWLPLAALAVVGGMQQPMAAHTLLAALRAVAPIGDRALLVGVQWLLGAGALRQV